MITTHVIQAHPSSNTIFKYNRLAQHLYTITGTVIAVAAIGMAGYKIYQHFTRQTANALYEAAKTNNVPECRRLIEAKVDPNTINKAQQTALQTAIAHEALQASKALIDSGAELTAENRAQLQVQLSKAKVLTLDQELFLQKCPNPCKPEIFVENHFQPLSETTLSQLLPTRGIALFNIADESLRPGYGLTMGVYRNSPAYLERMAEMA